MHTRIAAAIAALIIAVAAPATSAMAVSTLFPAAPDEVRTTGLIGVHDGVLYESHPSVCAPSSAAEGNANQQTRPVKQDGQTTGGNRC